MAEATKVDLAALSEKLSENLNDARMDFETSLRRVQDVIYAIDWHKTNPDDIAEEVGKVTFSNYDSAYDLIRNLVFKPLAQRDLLGENTDRARTHMFISPSLDAAEDKITALLSSATGAELHGLTGVWLGDAMRAALLAGQETSDRRDLADNLSLAGRYPTPDLQGNRDWLNTQYGYKRADRERNVYATLFALAQENVVWGYKQGVAIEQMHQSFTARYNRLFLNITAANIAAYRAEFGANIAELEARVRMAASKIVHDRIRFQRDSAEWELRIEQANDRLQTYVSEYASKLSANLQLLTTRVVGGKNVSDGYKNIYGAYSGQFTGVSLSNSTEGAP